MAQNICTMVSRNLTEDEWKMYVANDLPWEKTCSEKDFSIKVNAIK